MFWGCALFGQVVKKGNLDTHQKRKNWLITEKLLFGIFVFVLLFSFLCFFWRVKGSGEVARRATSLGPKPSLLVFFFFWFVFSFFFWGFKGQVRWPEGPPHLALNPPFWFYLFFSFLSLLVIEELFSLPQKGHFCLFFNISIFVSPQPFLASPFFNFSFSVSSFLSFFLLVFLFCFLLVPYFCLFVSFSFSFASVLWKEQHQNIKFQSFVSIHPLYFLWFPVLFLFKSLFLIFAFLDFELCFCSTSMVLVSKQTSKKKNSNFGSRGGLRHNGVFLNLCFAKCEKLSFLGGPFFLANFGWCSKNTIK